MVEIICIQYWRGILTHLYGYGLCGYGYILLKLKPVDGLVIQRGVLYGLSYDDSLVNPKPCGGI